MSSSHRSSSQTGSWNDWSGASLTRIMGLSFFASLVQNQYLFDSLKMLVLGTFLETGRRVCQWLIERFRIQYCITAQFDEGDPAYEWILLFLTRENVWRRSRDFRVNAKNSMRKWGVNVTAEIDGNADYVPTYESPQLFRWKGYWIEIKRDRGKATSSPRHGGQKSSTILLSIYTLDMKVLSSLVEECRNLYKETTRPNVTVHMADMPNYGPGFVWSNVKHKSRRPLSSIILMEGVVDSLVKDAQEFIETEEWYVEAGIPHRRGYLLHGPPGTGKTSTIYALAGELGLEIYALSLSSGFVDDSFLQKAASDIPKNSILLIEDIDCAFPSREDEDDDEHSTAPKYGMVVPPYGAARKSAVTLSGLLNVIDGVGSEEGKLFFATTNYIDRLDPALLRPGRIDKKIQYQLATQAQASALFLRFFARVGKTEAAPSAEKSAYLEDLATQFAADVPQHEFSTAELQGFLLSCKKQPEQAVSGIRGWVARELAERKEKAEQAAIRKAKSREKKDEREARQMEGTMAKFGAIATSMYSAGGKGPGMVTGGPVVPVDVLPPTHPIPPTPPTPPTPSSPHDSDVKLQPLGDSPLLVDASEGKTPTPP